jgi:hypothetical protein
MIFNFTLMAAIFFSSITFSNMVLSSSTSFRRLFDDCEEAIQGVGGGVPLASS